MEISPASRDDVAIRVEFSGDEIDRITEVELLTGEVIGTRDVVLFSPATVSMTSDEQMERAIKSILLELEDRLKVCCGENKLLEAQRLEQRTNYDIEMSCEMGFTSGIENYSRHMDGRKPGEPPYTCFDFSPKDFTIMVDESVVTSCQVKGMYNGDRARKQMLINYGSRRCRLLDNRPLKIDEFEKHV